jgi:hypothetical protein
LIKLPQIGKGVAKDDSSRRERVKVDEMEGRREANPRGRERKVQIGAA